MIIVAAALGAAAGYALYEAFGLLGLLLTVIIAPCIGMALRRD